tara:strand:- start:7608 stop:8216 length:609 start_codon:yes stop_codon:yes gene_type:complete
MQANHHKKKLLKRLFILGAGGHGRAVAEAATLLRVWDSIVFLDDSFPTHKTSSCWPILGGTGDLSNVASKYDEAFVAIGNQEARQQLINQIANLQVPLATIVHPHAWVSSHARIGQGVAIMAGAIVGFNAKIGYGVIVNANATVDHDVILEDFAHLGVGTHLAGGVIVRKAAWLQAGCSAGYHVEIEENATVLPGTALTAQF